MAKKKFKPVTSPPKGTKPREVEAFKRRLVRAKRLYALWLENDMSWTAVAQIEGVTRQAINIAVFRARREGMLPYDERVAMTSAEKTASWRSRNRANGWCPNHTGVKPAKGYETCSECLVRRRKPTAA